MAKAKSERHHWWPECLSDFWKDESGCVTWIQPDGKTVRSPPKNFGVIGNGHFVKFGSLPLQSTPWDDNFEREFQRADDNFSRIVEQLNSFRQEDRTTKFSRRERYVPVAADEVFVADLAECVISLAMRSPMNRAAFISTITSYRGELTEKEKSKLAALNLKGRHARFTKDIGTRVKIAVLFSPYREFIFGDGFYSTLNGVADLSFSETILVPLTPRISILLTRPVRCEPEPKISSIVVGPNEADTLNSIVQVYAKDAIYFRRDQPSITEHFSRGNHLSLTPGNNPVEEIIHALPGMIELPPNPFPFRFW